jgi:hypothetical protein
MNFIAFLTDGQNKKISARRRRAGSRLGFPPPRCNPLKFEPFPEPGIYGGTLWLKTYRHLQHPVQAGAKQ